MIAWAAARRAIGHPERAAADVVEAGVVEQGDALRVAAVLAAHADLEVLLHRATALGAELDQLTDAVRSIVSNGLRLSSPCSR